MPEVLLPREPEGLPRVLDGPLDDPVLSLIHLKVGENFQRINHSANELVRRSESFPGFQSHPACYRGVPMRALSEVKNLKTMIKLAENITGRLEEITNLAFGDLYEDNEELSTVQDDASERATVTKDKKDRRLSFSCRICARQDTPRWRCGPEGPGTLCNVCGLVFAKRKRRKQTTRARAISVSN
ncbi:hypothetical protein GQ53DRAFT_747360 [Thozetella sp. PMI_491]|nr:hypothetical protein GQ53DRAFT_747360 [Thozetella sp. PMI_491]